MLLWALPLVLWLSVFFHVNFKILFSGKEILVLWLVFNWILRLLDEKPICIILILLAHELKRLFCFLIFLSFSFFIVLIFNFRGLLFNVKVYSKGFIFVSLFVYLLVCFETMANGIVTHFLFSVWLSLLYRKATDFSYAKFVSCHVVESVDKLQKFYGCH